MKIYTPIKIRNRVQEYASRNVPSVMPQSHRGPIINELHNVISYSYPDQDPEEYRYMIFGWLMGALDAPLVPYRSADLSAPEWNGLKQWLGSKKIDGVWFIRESFADEARMVLERSICDFVLTRKAEEEEGVSVVLGELLSAERTKKDQIEVANDGMTRYGIH